eukprot:TRINITY_DN9032_c0_g1_i1.p1 TRINITY_DN9032_c0_g1~~TRINITY_DN9032_c0_g1_i1.p1  ORF type:complete len:997 (+),score=213.00 TRINITY_DN9032_c0_g1_i1:24-3014(+)
MMGLPLRRTQSQNLGKGKRMVFEFKNQAQHITLVVGDHEPARSIKIRLSQQMNIPGAQIKFSYGGAVIEDFHSLFYLQENSVIESEIRIPKTYSRESVITAPAILNTTPSGYNPFLEGGKSSTLHIERRGITPRPRKSSTLKIKKKKHRRSRSHSSGRTIEKTHRRRNAVSPVNSIKESNLSLFNTTVSGLEDCFVGTEKRVVITTMTENGNRVIGGRQNVTCYVNGPQKTVPRIIDNGDGTYLAVFQVKASGLYELMVLINERELANSPYQMIFNPDTVADPESSTAAGLEGRVFAGRTSNFYIQGKDRFGNNLEKIDTIFNVNIIGPERLSGIVQYSGNGIYTVQYRVNLIGAYRIAVTVKGVHISGSPFDIIASPSALSYKHTMISEPKDTQGMLGQVMLCEVKALDKFGNAISGAKDNFSVYISGPGAYRISIDEQESGVYLMKYEVNTVGEYLVSIKYSRYHIEGSPFAVNIDGVAPATRRKKRVSISRNPFEDLKQKATHQNEELHRSNTDSRLMQETIIEVEQSLHRANSSLYPLPHANTTPIISITSNNDEVDHKKPSIVVTDTSSTTENVHYNGNNVEQTIPQGFINELNSAMQGNTVKDSTPVVVPVVRKRTRERTIDDVIVVQKYFRRAICISKHKRDIDNIVEKENTFYEFIEGEKKYLEILHIIRDVFLIPLQGLAGEPDHITMPQISIIFSNLEFIISVNTDFYEMLEACLDMEPSVRTEELAHVMLNMCSAFKYTYTQYVNNYDQSMKTLNYANGQKGFAKFLEENSMHPDIGHLSLPSLLISPVQKLMKYALIMKRLLECSIEGTSEYMALSEASTTIVEVNTFINNNKRKAENLSKLLELQEKIIGWSQEYFSEERIFIKEDSFLGKIRLHNSGPPKPKDMHFILFNDALLVASYLPIKKHKKKKKDKSHDDEKPRLELETMVDLSRIEIEDSDDKDAIIVVGQSCVVSMMIEDTYIRSVWYNDILKCKENCSPTLPPI